MVSMIFFSLQTPTLLNFNLIGSLRATILLVVRLLHSYPYKQSPFIYFLIFFLISHPGPNSKYLGGLVVINW